MYDLEVRSSSQWFTVMDRMIKLAMAEIITKTSVAEYCVSRLVIFQHDNKRRGVSMRMSRDEWSWEDVVSAMLGFLARPTLQSFLHLRIDRAYSQDIINEFLAASKGYLELVERAANDPDARLIECRERMDSIHAAVGLKPGHRDMVSVISNVAYLNNEITRFRNRILNVYSDYIERMASYDAANHPLNVSDSDTKQNYYLATIKAINHFNQDRGSFKPYLDIWLKKARNTGSHVVGSAYTPPSGAKANHIAVTVEDMDNVREASSEDTAGNSHYDLANLVRIVDPDGYLWAAMGYGANP